jgi:methionine-rich copper-binding protein CopC
MISVRAGGARAIAWVAVGVVALLALPIAPASAHATLIGSDPKDGATVEKLPGEVSLEFNEEVAAPAFVEVTASDGTDVGSGDPEVLGDVVTLPLAPEGPAGTYTLAFRVVSADGHPVSGELTFDVLSGVTSDPLDESDAAAAEGGGADAAADDDGDGFIGSHVEHIAVGAVGLVLGAVLVGLGLRARD